MYYAGSPALSNFRLDKLLKTAQVEIPSLTQIEAQYLYFIHAGQPFTEADEKQLCAILPDCAPLTLSFQPGQHLLVIPRPGTISPWSSKATDIVSLCGLSAKVKRVERGIWWRFITAVPLEETALSKLSTLIHDRMTEAVWSDINHAAELIFQEARPRPLRTVNILQQGKTALVTANQEQGLALSEDEMDYLLAHFITVQRNPTDVELMMFAQANSEHCRHKIFNADWIIQGETQPLSLFQMIRQTYQQHPGKVKSAYHDNAAILQGFPSYRWMCQPHTHEYRYLEEDTDLLMKVETHNHPTAISPFPGAATGSGGEIRDEGATGQGAKPKAGLTGFSVSHLQIPDFRQPWETPYGTPTRLATALQIMLEGPIGASAFNNEFGRPALCGYFRSFEITYQGQRRGYHKPIMIAGGVGNIRPCHIQKQPIPPGSLLIVLGGPAMLIGLGGGAASSMAAGLSQADLDFASVQRGNPEMQRRCQEVIDACWQLGEKNPILSLHDVGAGGLSNAFPELINDGGCGGRFDLRAIPSADPSLSPLELWCNEAQERYVLAILKENLPLFESFCHRERCPFAVIGQTTVEKQLQVYDDHQAVIDMPLGVLLGKPPKMCRRVEKQATVNPNLSPPATEEMNGFEFVVKLWENLKGRRDLTPLARETEFEPAQIQLTDVALGVLQFPTVSSKNFLITIGDRTVGGLTVRDQMVGPWQVPVADCAVTATSFGSVTGEAMAMGERTPLALLNAPASGRMAVGEAITNIAAACIDDLSDLVLSANWMAAGGQPEEDVALFETVKAVAMELCPALGIAIPVGKDSLSMRTVWEDKSVTSPLSLIVSAFARVSDIRRTLTPQLQGRESEEEADSVLLLIDLGRGQNRMGGSVLAQIYSEMGDTPPDVDNPEDLKRFFQLIQRLNREGKILAYHDRSDGGLFITLCEMAFASHKGLEILLSSSTDLARLLFNEELGAVIEVRRDDVEEIYELCKPLTVLNLGMVNLRSDDFVLYHGSRCVWEWPRVELQQVWTDITYQMQRLRDNPECAQQEYEALFEENAPGLSVQLSHFEPLDAKLLLQRPRLAILREQGVNGQVEMAAAFDRAGFTCVDVHTSDILEGRVTLKDFQGFVACGGFSYGDVLGAGGGWAKSILFNSRAYDEFSAFFHRPDTFALGVCNGCQMMAQLRDLIPGAETWPSFVRNRSEQFEARLVMVEVLHSPSIFLQGMAGSRLPIVVSHGEGRAQGSQLEQAFQQELVTLRYVNNRGQVTETYPANPNGSPFGATGFTTPSGRFTIMMPHPERVFLRTQYSWLPADWKFEEGPWMQLFWNARRFVH